LSAINSHQPALEGSPSASALPRPLRLTYADIHGIYDMTGPLRGTQSPPIEDHNVVIPDPSKGELEKDRFQRAPDRLMRNTISVDGPDRLIESAHTQRQSRFQYLVRRCVK
jgi:hypothetical protein